MAAPSELTRRVLTDSSCRHNCARAPPLSARNYTCTREAHAAGKENTGGRGHNTRDLTCRCSYLSCPSDGRPNEDGRVALEALSPPSPSCSPSPCLFAPFLWIAVAFHSTTYSRLHRGRLTSFCEMHRGGRAGRRGREREGRCDMGAAIALKCTFA